MPRLPDGSVVPSTLGLAIPRRFSDGNAFNETFLRMGEVQDIVYPDDKRSRSKKFIEYRVLVQRRSNGTGNSKVYENCMLWNPLAGLADRCEFTLRADKSENRDKNGLSKGSKVVLAFINGEANTPLIMGGVRDEVDTDSKVKGLDDTEIKKLGHHLYFNFNGISFYIDKDGQCALSYNGATKIDGATDVDSSNTGTGFKLLKNGDARVGDKDNKNSLFIDHQNSKVVIKRDNAFELGDATDKMLLGESHRMAQKQMHQDLAINFASLKAALQSASAALSSAGSSMTTPIYGAVAAAPQITSAAQFLNLACTYVDQLKQAIDKYENKAGQKNDFLSKKNKAD